MAAAAMTRDAQNLPFIRNLASSDRKLRDESVSSLRAFLSTRHGLSDVEARKLWTGLYYAMWMSDRPRAQQALATDMASLAAHLPDAAGAASWLAGFWEVLGAQWPSVDALRVDKYLLLVRRVFAAHLRLARRPDGSGAVIDVLREWCFDPCDARRLALGLRLHLLDIWVDELEREGFLAVARAQGDTEKDEERRLVDAVVAMVGRYERECLVKPVRERALQSLDDERLSGVASTKDDDEDDDGDDDDDDDEWGGFQD